MTMSLIVLTLHNWCCPFYSLSSFAVEKSKTDTGSQYVGIFACKRIDQYLTKILPPSLSDCGLHKHYLEQTHFVLIIMCFLFILYFPAAVGTFQCGSYVTNYLLPFCQLLPICLYSDIVSYSPSISPFYFPHLSNVLHLLISN